MTRTGLIWAAMGFAALGACPVCTNTKDDVSAYSVVKGVIEARRAGRQGTPKIDDRIVQLQVKTALERSRRPLALMRIEKTGSVALLAEIETNGPYSTWSAWGTVERRSITTRGNLITSTRGLGTDLMSSSVNTMLHMVTRLEDGIGQQVLRHLDGENQIEEIEAYCAFTPDEKQRFTSGELNLQVTRVDVFCKTDTGSFSNYYLVSQSGRIVESRVWLGEGLQYFTFSLLR